MKPNAKLYKKDALYLRELIERAGVSQRKAALLVGVPERTMRDYLNPRKENSIAPYAVEFALECLAEVRQE